MSGTWEERGLLKWRQRSASQTENFIYTGSIKPMSFAVDEVYDLPLLTRKRLAKYPILRYIPFLPSYESRNTDTKMTISANGPETNAEEV